MIHKYLLAALLLTAAAPAALAQTTGSVGIGTATPNAKAALDVTATDKGVLVPRLTQAQRTAIAAPVPVGLLVYQTDGTPGFWYYEATAGWTSLSAGSSTGDNLGNHSATQTLNLNEQRLLGTVGTSLGDSTAQVELNASVGTQSTALITRSSFGARYSRVILSGYGKLPEGTSTANDYGIWATAYRGGGWAGFFSAGSTTTPLRWVGICQNPGYNGTGSAIRIVDGTQGAGKVLMSDGSGYGTWQPVPAPTTAGGNFNLGSYSLVGNGGSAGIAISNTGNVGIGAAGPTSTLQVAGSVAARIRTLSSGSVADNDYTVLVGGSIALPAPSAANTGRIHNLLTTGGGYVVTGVFRDASGAFGTYGLNNSAGARGIVVQSDGTNWWIISRQ
ncbi:hypothetical protein [Hymenobacter edaphi]|uniref:Uncharacterized protein n=1 Tax=Hymenobacter edaphi TaxID=2211146 RepID=A0A328BHX1_9BACT|nr:hypothetical protein [Hymenobacter edaphi]RAK64658.1 hypothetical protein DLM85_18415 [Hymenobacter edaphi]